MSERYFISPEVLLDMVMRERSNHSAASKLLDLAKEGEVTLCMCVSSIDEALFVLAKYMGEEDAHAFMRATLEAFEIFPLTEAICMQALDVSAKHFLDAVLIVCAETKSVDGIIVHDKTRFEAADIKVIPIDSLA